jgi:radical SAM protein with 4Fe4S-binding SPASM domain
VTENCTFDHFLEIKAANRATFRDEYARGCLRLIARPRILFVELTRFCNLACGMCRSVGQIGPDQTMQPEMFNRVAEELFPAAEVVDLRGWGESLILSDFIDQLQTARAYGCEVRIVTNLSFNRPAVLDALADARAYVGVSLDAATDDVLSRIRSGARLERLLQNLMHLANSYRLKGIGDRISIYVTCQRDNISELEKIIDLAKGAGVRRIALAPVTCDPHSPFSITGFEKQLCHAVDKIAARANRTETLVFQTANLWPGQIVHEQHAPCIHPWAYCYISYDGRVGFCDHLIGPAGDPFIIGDLRQQSFDDVWNSEAWIALRKEHLSERRPGAPFFHECDWCYRNRFTDFEDILEPVHAKGRREI